jgi:uncharacterized protein (DUF4415 family)
MNDKHMKKQYDFNQGRRGAVIKPQGKQRITIHLDRDIIDAFRARAENEGRGYQTLINEALRQHISGVGKPIDTKNLRRILREELSRKQR